MDVGFIYCPRSLGCKLKLVPQKCLLGPCYANSYNSTDAFAVIEVSSGDYGDHMDRMVAEIENGRSTNYCKKVRSIAEDVIVDTNDNAQIRALPYAPTTVERRKNSYNYESSNWNQFKILLFRMWLQMWRDTVRFIYCTNCT